MAGRRRGKPCSANTIYFIVKMVLFSPVTLKIGKVELMPAHKMTM